MFSRLLKKRIAAAIRGSCVKNLPELKETLKCLYDDLEQNRNMSNEDLVEKVDICIRHYKNTVADSIFNPLIESPSMRLSFLRANYIPQVTGLPEKYTTDCLADNGFDASAVFAICYFMMRNKPVKRRDYELMGALALYQKELVVGVMDAIAEDRSSR